MKYAWVENNIIRDIAPGEPSRFYAPQVAAYYSTQVPDHVERDAMLVGGVWVNRPVVVEIVAVDAPATRTWTVNDIRAGLTLSEKAKWDNDSAPEIVTAKQEMATPQEQAHTTDVLQLLVDAQVISQASMDKVLA